MFIFVIRKNHINETKMLFVNSVSTAKLLSIYLSSINKLFPMTCDIYFNSIKKIL